MCHWCLLLREAGQSSTLFRRMFSEGEVVDEKAVSVKAVFAARATATLEKRAGSLLLYRSWRRSLGYEAISFDEHYVFEYFVALVHDAAPPSRLQSAREALHLAGTLLEVPFRHLLESSRLRGIAFQELGRKAVLRQRSPLTASMVMDLELLVASTAADRSKRIIAGTALFILFGRARVGDIARATMEPKLDAAEGDAHGFVETFLVDHKTAKPGTRKALPVTAPICGLTHHPWARTWLTLRSEAGIDAAVSKTMLPMRLSDGTFSSARMRVTEFGDILRSILREIGYSPEEVSNIGSHSLKATVLSWCAKAGTPKESRRALGYHVSPGDKATAAYSRDFMSGPLREMIKVIQLISTGAFAPDATRSGRFPSVVDRPPSARSSASGSSSSSSLPAVSETDDFDDISFTPQNLVMNTVSGMLHLMDHEAAKLICGRLVPQHCEELTSWPAAPRLCKRCF